LAPQTLSLDEVSSIIEADFGAAARELLHTMRSTPVAVGAAAQVHRATLSDGTTVAIKVRRSEGAGDFALAAQWQERIWWLFAGHGSVVVPALKRAWCSARVVTSEFISGATLEEWLATRPNDEARNRAGEALFDFYVGMAFEHGLYFGEVDPGNQLFWPDGRVAFVSFAGAREARAGCMERLAALTHTVWGGGGDEVVRALYGPMLRDEVAAFDPPSPELLGRIRAAELRETAPVALALATLMAQIGARANFRRRLDALLSGYAQPAFDVVLVDPGDSAITMARALLDATGLPLREIEVMIKRSPQTIKQAVPRAEAEALRVRLEQAGARVEIKLV